MVLGLLFLLVSVSAISQTSPAEIQKDTLSPAAATLIQPIPISFGSASLAEVLETDELEKDHAFVHLGLPPIPHSPQTLSREISSRGTSLALLRVCLPIRGSPSQA